MEGSDNKKLFITDLDGTLLTYDKKISPETRSSLENFVSAGNRFAICTGRDINSARLVYKELGFDFPGSYLIAYNGGQIYDVDKKETVYRLGIEVPVVKEILKLAKEHNIHVHAYNDDNILSPGQNECLAHYCITIKTPVIIAEDITLFMDKPTCKMICIEMHDHEKQERFRLALEERFGAILTFLYSNPIYLEIIPKKSGKGNALLELSRLSGIPVERIIAAGDEENDISMIEAAGHGIAMKNATDNVKAAADIVTEDDNDHDGLAKYLRRFAD